MYTNSRLACLEIHSATEQNELLICNFLSPPLNSPFTLANCPARLHGFKLKEAVTGKGICKENLQKKKDIFQRGKMKEAAHLEMSAFVSMSCPRDS